MILKRSSRTVGDAERLASEVRPEGRIGDGKREQRTKSRRRCCETGGWRRTTAHTAQRAGVRLISNGGDSWICVGGWVGQQYRIKMGTAECEFAMSLGE